MEKKGENPKVVIEFEQGWEMMEKGVTKLINILEGLPGPQFNSVDYMKYYEVVYNMCTQKPPHDYCKELYGKFEEVMVQYIDSTVLPSLREKHDEFMLRDFVNRWANHKLMIRWLSRFFNYLERYFVARRGLPRLNEVGFNCFRVRVFEEIKEKVRDAVISMIDQEREGQQIDRALVKNALDIFMEMGKGNIDYYGEVFEPAMVQHTVAYYSRKAYIWSLEDSCSFFVRKADECLKREKDIIAHCWHVSTGQRLMEIVQHELSVNAIRLLEKEHAIWLAMPRDDKEYFSGLYTLFSKIPCLEPVSNLFKQYVVAKGTAFFKQSEDVAMKKKADRRDAVGSQLVFIGELMELHEKYLAFVKDCFKNHYLFHMVFQKAFEEFCSKDLAGCSTSEILATFFDNVLNKGRREHLNDDYVEETMEKAIDLLACISDKDLFVKFYSKKLAHRLLLDKNANNDRERRILSKMKQQFGGQFTCKMEGMMSDLTLARESQTSFEEYLKSSSYPNLGIDLTVTVLTNGFWPSYKSFNLNLPKEMVQCVEVFREFYQTKTKHRKLTWIYSLGTCNVIGNFDPKSVELIVTTSQAAALMLFNDSDRLSYSEIMTHLNLTDDDTVRLLHSLSCAKYKILKKEPSTKTISPTDYFEFNSTFTDKMRRIKISLPPVDDKKKVTADVDKERRYAVDASIIRIMKSRKVLDYQQLVMECADQLSRMFKPDTKVIKKRIEDLIARDYLERDEENVNLFRYLA